MHLCDLGGIEKNVFKILYYYLIIYIKNKKLYKTHNIYYINLSFSIIINIYTMGNLLSINLDISLYISYILIILLY